MGVPVFQAYRFVKVLKGGTTRPWLIEVDTGKERPELYVMKLFTEKDLRQRNFLAHELLGSTLAMQFELRTPAIALIEPTEAFISSVPMTQRSQLNRCGTALFFASVFVGEGKEFSNQMQMRYLTKDDIPSILAFDMMIYNVDRTRRKPNLLFDRGDFYLIDHEGAFASYPPDFLHTPHVLKQHLLYSKAKQLLRKSGAGTFDSFLFYLQNLHFSSSESVLTQLEGLGLEVTKERHWLEYLKKQQTSGSKFINLLIELLK